MTMRQFILLEGVNPFDGVRPSLGPFREALQNPINVFLGLALFLGFVACAFFIIMGLVKAAGAHAENNAHGRQVALEGLKWPVIALVALSAVGTLFGVIIGL